MDAQWRVTSGQQDPATVERLLRSRPDWFGMPAANAQYVEAARELPTYLAPPTQNTAAGHADPVGVLLARRHFAEAGQLPAEHSGDGVELLADMLGVGWAELVRIARRPSPLGPDVS